MSLRSRPNVITLFSCSEIDGFEWTRVEGGAGPVIGPFWAHDVVLEICCGAHHTSGGAVFCSVHIPPSGCSFAKCFWLWWDWRRDMNDLCWATDPDSNMPDIRKCSLAAKVNSNV